MLKKGDYVNNFEILEVRVEHYRVDVQDGEIKRYERSLGKLENGFTPYEMGGKTECVIDAAIDNGGVVEIRSVSFCSNGDAFNYRVGREIACGRAESALRDMDINVVSVDDIPKQLEFDF